MTSSMTVFDVADNLLTDVLPGLNANTARRHTLDFVAVTTTYAILATDQCVLCNATGAAFTATLPAVASVPTGTVIVVIKTDSSGNAVTVDGSGAETINGSATDSLATQYTVRRYFTDGVTWFKL